MRERRAWRLLVAGLVLTDALALLASAWAATAIHPAAQQRMTDEAVLVVAILASGLVLLALLRAYDPVNLLEGSREYGAVVRACVYGLAGFSIVNFWTEHPVSRTWIGLAWVLAAVLLPACRWAVRHAVRALWRSGLLVRRVLMVGADANAVALASQLMADRSGTQVVGFLDDYHAAGTVLLPGVRVLGRPMSLQQIARRTRAGEAIIMPQALPWETLNQLLTAAAVTPDGPRVHLSAGFYDLLTTSVRFHERHRVALLTLNKARLSRRETVVKRVLDCSVAALLLVCFAPVIALMALWQAAHGKRPLLERREVRGGRGEPFGVLRFRSPAPFRSDFVQKLPGLLNVLRGHLSVVGPRPVDAGDVPSDFVLMARLKPGLTGPWREIDDAAEQSLLDLYYIRAYSVALDIQVLSRRLRNRLPRRPAPSQGAVVTAERPA
ncbi:MAG: sugar transferase [Candidatus Dormibacteraeota bacterium]|nr:sugar transferase [Candidatus Dormibacteraeota bacterium]MBV9524377.1 sugar transferase [Candidatus Dormibacteraeota bacterium]